MNPNISGNSAATMGRDNLPYHHTSHDFLVYCLNILGIGLHTELGIQISDIVKRLAGNGFKAGKWLDILKTIAEMCYKKDGYVFTQSQLYDFLILATKQVGEKESTNFRLSELVFKIYKDILENYQRSDDSLKSRYPLIIIDTISALVHGKDNTGRQISPHGLIKYFEERKSLPHSRYTVLDPLTNAVKGDKNLIDSLSHITGREDSKLIPLLRKLDATDLDKLRDLCVNYDKLQKYFTLMNSENEFRKEVEKVVGRKLTYNQYQHASVSVRKSRSYIENVLDGKFLPHGSHGINHIRHNLEYGYQVIGLIERKRRGPRRSH